MPRVKTVKKIKRENNQQNGSVSSESTPSMDLDQIKKSPNESDSGSKESNLEQDTNVAGSPDVFSGEMTRMLKKFNTDLNKTMKEKKRKLEQITQESTRSTTKKVLETNKTQSADRRALLEHYQTEMSALIQQGEADVEKLKELEDKIQKTIVQQQKHQQQVRIASAQRLKSMKTLSEEFCKGMADLETAHVGQYSAMHSELRKEMAMLQKKILMDIQQQEMMNVRKSLTKMFH